MANESNEIEEPSEADIARAVARATKLLTRSKDKGATVEEADTALKLVQELMAKYNFNLAVVEAADPEKRNSVERVKEEFPGRARYQWQRSLAKYVAEANFCFHILHFRKRFAKQRTTTVCCNVFVGRKNNVITAQRMYEYLTETIEVLVPITDNSQRLSRDASSWRIGCAEELCRRLAKRRQDLIEQHDARARLEAEERAAGFKRAAEAKANLKGLPPNRDLEAKATLQNLQSGARVARSPARPQDQTMPEADGVWTPEGEVEDDQPSPSVALVLASAYDQSEQDANADLAWGRPLGFTARRRAAEAEYDRRAAEAEAEEELEQIDAPVKQETERQRRARERREEEEYEKDRRRWAREEAAEERKAAAIRARVNPEMYRAGKAKGKDIGLDIQVGGGKSTKQLKEG